MLDVPLHKNIVTFADLAKFNVSTFGADVIIKHLSEGGNAVAPVFPMESVFLRRFKHAVMDDDDSDETDEDGEQEAGSDEGGTTVDGRAKS
ncbi:MAG: hypothetical protein HC767_13565 [Akkermansiaceae bacterium]|nr:hypothetical protein [Akkermansiaceae bacterium]